MKAGKIVLIVLGVLVLLLAAGVLLGGGALIVVNNVFTDADGYLATREISIDGEGYAVLSETARLDRLTALARWPATVRVRAAPELEGAAVFLGVAPAERAESYLAEVPHDIVEDFTLRPERIAYRRIPGTDEPAPPVTQQFWVASVTGPGKQTLQWDAAPGNWVLVLMNADGAAGVRASITLGLRLPWLGRLGIGVLIGGALVFLMGLACVVFASRGPVPLVPAPTEPTDGYPVRLTGELSEPLSPALWLFKWLLLLPHYIVLGFLWVGLCVSWFVALVSIVVAGRYPRILFDYIVGVLRWTWRVGFYGYQALGTDRYPPFSLRAGSYPADLEVVYPERLSRGLALVKWWLLALPQLVLVGLFQGGGGQHWGGGLVPLLSLYAGVALLFTGRYPQGMFTFIMGMNRWTYRVMAYVALMTDRYPPFRLEE